MNSASTALEHPMSPEQVYPFSPELPSKSQQERHAQRMTRLFRDSAGPLVSWLLEEAQLQGHGERQLARALGVTVEYWKKLKASKIRADLASQAFFEACARYLGVPPVVCKLLAGNIRMTDFCYRETEEQATERALRQMMQDPVVRALMPGDITSLDMRAKQALVLLYSEVSSADVLGGRQLPEIVHWLQRAALVCDDHALNARQAAFQGEFAQ